MSKAAYISFAIGIAMILVGGVVTKYLDATAGMGLAGAGLSLVTLTLRQPMAFRSPDDQLASKAGMTNPDGVPGAVPVDK